MKKISETDWERLSKMADEEIDYSDIPQLSKSLFDRAQIHCPEFSRGMEFQGGMAGGPRLIDDAELLLTLYAAH
jgi:hypothetical protein